MSEKKASGEKHNWDKFTAKDGDMKECPAESIINRTSTFYEFFNEDGTPKRHESEKRDIKE